MNSPTDSQKPEKLRQPYFLQSEDILRFFLGTDETIDTIIKCKGSEIELVTSDLNLYEALGSIKEHDNIQGNKLVKFLEVVDIISYRKNLKKEKPVLREERVDELRKLALKNG